VNPPPWDIRREGRRWTNEEVKHRLYQAPEKIEFVGGIFASERERLTVLGMLLENLGIDKAVSFGNLADWKAAIAARDAAQGRATPGITSDQALAIARQDAEKAYRDLSPFRVEISLERDGWHIDYELKNRRLHGGGPRYVIDAQTGMILAKRYEQ
jgi:hypothetical protein